jgi:hypothetical protein
MPNTNVWQHWQAPKPLAELMHQMLNDQMAVATDTAKLLQWLAILPTGTVQEYTLMLSSDSSTSVAVAKMAHKQLCLVHLRSMHTVLSSEHSVCQAQLSSQGQLTLPPSQSP